MAIVRCKSCGKEMDYVAEHCPHCGRTGPWRELTQTVAAILGSILFILFMANPKGFMQTMTNIFMKIGGQS